MLHFCKVLSYFIYYFEFYSSLGFYLSTIFANPKTIKTDPMVQNGFIS